MFGLSEDGAIRRGNEGEAAKSEEEFCKRFGSFADTLMSNPRMAGFCYTQLYDVEQEQNGLYTYGLIAKFSQSALYRIKECNNSSAAIEKDN